MFVFVVFALFVFVLLSNRGESHFFIDLYSTLFSGGFFFFKGYEMAGRKYYIRKYRVEYSNSKIFNPYVNKEDEKSGKLYTVYLFKSKNNRSHVTNAIS